MADTPDPATLTGDGLPASGQGRILLLACGALAHEILALKRLNGWQHLDLHCLPAILHNSPEQIPDRVEAAVEKHRGAYDEIFVVYADCGTGGLLDRVCQEEGVERIAGPHCYSFFDGNARFATRAEAGEITAFYLTDFLARQFDTLIWKGLGIDRHPELLEMMFGNYRKLVYLAQTEDEGLKRKAEAAAARLGLAYEYRPTGMGDLGPFIARSAGA